MNTANEEKCLRQLVHVLDRLLQAPQQLSEEVLSENLRYLETERNYATIYQLDPHCQSENRLQSKVLKENEWMYYRLQVEEKIMSRIRRNLVISLDPMYDRQPFQATTEENNDETDSEPEEEGPEEK